MRAFSPALRLNVVSACASAPISSSRSECGTSTARLAVRDVHHRGLDALERADDAAGHEHEAEAGEQRRAEEHRELGDEGAARRGQLLAGVLLGGRQRGLGEVGHGAETRHRLAGPVVDRDRRYLAGRKHRHHLVALGEEIGAEEAVLGLVDRGGQRRRQGRAVAQLLHHCPAGLGAADQVHLALPLRPGDLLLRHEGGRDDDRGIAAVLAHDPGGVAHRHHLVDERILVFREPDQRVADPVEHGEQVGRGRFEFLGQAGPPLALRLGEIGVAFLRQRREPLRRRIELACGRGAVRHVDLAQPRERRRQRRQLRATRRRDLPHLHRVGRAVVLEHPHRERAVEPQIVQDAERLAFDLGDALEPACGRDLAPRAPGAGRQHGDERHAHDGDDGLKEEVDGDASEHGHSLFAVPPARAIARAAGEIGMRKIRQRPLIHG